MEPSSDSRDDSFRARVQKAFGSLSSSHSPWSLTDDEVEKREWRRDTAGSNRNDDETPCSSSFEGLFAKDRKNSRCIRRERKDDLEDLNGDDEDEQLGGGSERDRDEWDIRSSIGLDCTLDNEEEEDEFDKVAEGRENAGDRLYMSDVTDHGPYLNSHNVLPSSVHDSPRDARANRFVRIRLKEDEAVAQKFGSDHICDKSMSNVEESRIKSSEDGGKHKSILKRKDDAATSKAQKRVRFDPGCKDDCEEASEKHKYFSTGNPEVVNALSADSSLLARNAPRVPDYVLNPSKYTRYSFDSASEVDDESNGQVSTDFLKLEKMLKPNEFGSEIGDASSHLPKSVTFIPRKKASSARPVDSSCELNQNQEDGSKQSLIGIAAGETQRSEVSVPEDEPETNAADMSSHLQKSCRHYRTKSKLDDPVS